MNPVGVDLFDRLSELFDLFGAIVDPSAKDNFKPKLPPIFPPKLNEARNDFLDPQGWMGSIDVFEKGWSDCVEGGQIVSRRLVATSTSPRMRGARNCTSI